MAQSTTSNHENPRGVRPERQNQPGRSTLFNGFWNFIRTRFHRDLVDAPLSGLVQTLADLLLVELSAALWRLRLGALLLRCTGLRDASSASVN